MKALSPIDLHCHSQASDGELTPSALVQHAADHGITHMALTDHDTIAGLPEARAQAQALGIHLINGVELSVSWENKTLHIVGLNFAADHPAMTQLLQELQNIRQQRAEAIAKKLERLGVKEPLSRALALASKGQITRPHFARLLIEDGLVTDMKQAFKRYLGAGKPAAVKTQWIDLPRAVDTIQQAGGLAVLAHPLRYNLTASWRERMYQAFVDAGGDGVEVSAGPSQQAHDMELSTRAALRHKLLASMGSDFHAHEQRWIPYARLHPLSTQLTPIWTRFAA